MRGKREQYLAEFIFSLMVGAILAITLCVILPEIKSKTDIFMLYFPFWFCGTVVCWEVIDAIDVIKQERKEMKHEWKHE